MAALDIFLETELDPVMQRVCFIEGPAAMGFERWWAFGERYYVEPIRTILNRMTAEGELEIQVPQVRGAAERLMSSVIPKVGRH